MRYAILSDIHGNVHALEMVLRSVKADAVDQIVCLGDTVGYGPDPGPCIDLLLQNECTVIAGNHDLAVCEKIECATFNVLARESVLWTRTVLNGDAVEFLTDLPLVSEFDGFTTVHGTLHTPELFDYVQTSYDADLSMQVMQQPLCFIGHSHVPIAFVKQEDTIKYNRRQELLIDPAEKVIVNVGSVGQPRDLDPRACYAVYEAKDRKVSIKRVAYDVEGVVTRIREAGLPSPLGERLRVGR